MQPKRLIEGYVPYKVNVHAHSNLSDGVLSPQEINDRAQEWGGIIAITDHNTAKAHEDLDAPNILPGIEVKVSEEDEGIDILLYHTREKLLAFCEEIIYPAYDHRNPIYAPTRLRLLSLLQQAQEAECEIIIPHYAHFEGLSELPRNVQREAARNFPLIIELNGRLGGTSNLKAKLFALRHKLPTIAAADSHLGSQYTSSFTTIPLPADIPPIARHLLQMLRQHSNLCSKHLEDPTFFDKLATGIQNLRRSNFYTLRDYIKRFWRKWKRFILDGDGDPDE